MLIKFFKHGNTTNPTGGRSGGGGAVKDYLLGKDGKERAGAELVRGNADITTQIINASKNKKIYTSGVISFSESEHPTAQAKNDLMQSFEETIFNGLDPDQYSGYWVEHQDKDRTELHFVFANTELTTGKALPVYFHATDLDLVNSWGKVMIDKYGFIDPNSPEHQRDLAPTTVFDNDKAKDKDNEFEQAHEPKKLNNEQLKEQITNRLLAEIDGNPQIKTRDDIVKTLGEMGHEVTRQGKTENKKGKVDKSQDFISIKNPNGGQNLRLKGALFSPDFTRKDLPRYKEQRIADYKASHAQRIADYQADLQTHLQKRKDYLQKRFPLDRKPVDNDLTRKLAEIQQAGEIKLNQAQATLAKYNNDYLTEQGIKQYTALTQSELLAREQSELQVITDIEYKVASGDDLTPSDEISYRNAKTFTNSLDTILEQQRQAQEQAEQARLEAQRLADEARKQSITNDRLNRLQSIVTEATQKLIDSLPRNPERLQAIKALHETLLTAIEDRVRNNPDMTDSEFEIEVGKYTDSKEHIASVPVVEQVERDRLARLEAEKAVIKSQFETLKAVSGGFSNKAYDNLKALSPTERALEIEPYQRFINNIQDRAGRKVIPDFDDKVITFQSAKNLLATNDYITQEENRLAEQSKPVIDRPAPTTAPEVQSPSIEQPAPVKVDEKAIEEAPAPTADQLINDRLAQLEIDVSALDPSDIAEFREMLGIDTASYAEIIETEQALRQAVAETQAQARDLSQPLTDEQIGTHYSNLLALSLIDDFRKSGELDLKQKLETATQAQQGKIYVGEVIAVNEHGAYQQTSQGVIVHPTKANNDKIKVGTGYKVEYAKNGIYFEELVYVGKQANKDKSLDHDPAQQTDKGQGR